MRIIIIIRIILCEWKLNTLHTAFDIFLGLVRLVNASSPCAGRAEVYHDGQWGTVDGYGTWDMKAAAVVCKELDCGAALSAPGGAHFGEGSGPVVTSRVQCRGSESTLRDCYSRPWGHYPGLCSHPTIHHLRLANGGSPCAGRVEVYHDGQWGTVYGYGWDMLDAAVVCKELGCGDALSASGGAHFGEGSGRLVTADVQCSGSESTLRGCRSWSWGHYSWSHSYDAGVICSGGKIPRLVNGSSHCAGRVELYNKVAWGTVCGNQLSQEMAEEICKHLGCGFAAFVFGDAHFGEGSGNVIGRPDCGHQRDAGVFCSEHHSIRLIGGNNSCSGRVDLQRYYRSGTICDYYWDLQDADVLCRQLDCGFALSSGPGAQFGNETGLIWKTNFNCLGNESRVLECPVSFWDIFSCTHNNDVSVVCSGKQWHLRLESGGSRCDGRVEIYHNGTWGRLLDDSWNISDADVICRQLNCGSAVSVYNSSQYGEGSGPVWINNVQCAGTETHIWNCPYSTVASSSRTSRDVGVLCSGEFFVHPMISCSGTVEVYRHGDWRRVRDQFWDLNDANVVCRQMGCGPAIRSYNSTVYREGERSPWLKDVHCQGNETNLLKCKPSRRNQSTEDMCDVGVQCSKDTHIRLMDRGSSCAGRVEIYYNETWGTVCDDSWGSREADVVCKQLGCGSAVDAISAAPCGSASGQVWLDEVRCSGKESALSECRIPQHKMLRLVNGQHSCEGRVEVDCSGRVEILSNNTWGTVCDDSWDIREASVVCGQLDCGPALRAVGQAGFGQGAGQIWLDELHCRGSESFLWDCVSASAGHSDCVHKEDAGVVCSGRDPVTQCLSTNLKIELLRINGVCDALQVNLPDNQSQPHPLLINIPFVVCIVLGILLAVVLFALIVRMDSNSSGRGETGF
uniref:SRCR domain-containing protein n=1 Tax=Callorhinchus milii TaxID=7868 RepID=A0A4W3I4T0_CALMI